MNPLEEKYGALLKGKSILITGAYGLVGWNLQKSLHGIDCTLTLVKYDDIPESGKYDIIIHAAGYGQPKKFSLEKVKTITANTTLTERLFSLLRPDGKFLFVSSSEVYSGLDNPPFKEVQIGRSGPDHPRACYIESKRCGEAICYAYREMGYDVKIARLALAYGPGVKKGDARVLHSLIEQGLKGDIQLLDSGEAERTYCYISDAVGMMWNILLKGEQVIYNVGGNSHCTILGLAETIGHQLGVNVIKGTGGLIDAPAKVDLDMRRYESEFGKEDLISLPEGLRRTIEWQKSL